MVWYSKKKECIHMYLLAVFIPPLAVLMAKKPGQALINVILTFIMWLPGIIHAWMIVKEYKADQRTERIIQATTNRAS